MFFVELIAGLAIGAVLGGTCKVVKDHISNPYSDTDGESSRQGENIHFNGQKDMDRR
jgi:hypothetical protein